MSYYSDYQRLTDRFQHVFESMEHRSDLRRVDQITRQELGETFDQMAHFLNDLPLPFPSHKFEAYTDSTAAAENDLMDGFLTHEYAHIRRLLADDLTNYSAPLIYNAKHDYAIRPDMVLTRWSHQAANLAMVADKATEVFAHNRAAYPGHPVSSIAPEQAISLVGVHNLVDNPILAKENNTYYELDYEPIGPGAHKNFVMVDGLKSQLAASTDVRERVDAPVTTTIRIYVPSVGINHPIPAGTKEDTVVVRHSSDDPSNLTVASPDRTSIRIPTPQTLGINPANDQLMARYTQSISDCARAQPLLPEVRQRRLDHLRYRVEAIEQIRPASIIDDSSLGQHYLNERTDIERELTDFAGQIDPYNPEDRPTLRDWASLYARVNGDDTRELVFGVNKHAQRYPASLRPDWHLDYHGHAPEVSVSLTHRPTGETHALEHGAISGDAGNIDRHRLASHLHDTFGITIVTGPSVHPRPGETNPVEYTPVSQVEPNGAAFSPLGTIRDSGAGEHCHMSAYEAVNAISRDYDGLRWTYRMSHQTDQGIEVMTSITAFGAREMTSGTDIGIAEERVFDLEGQEINSSYVDIAYYDGDQVAGERSHESAIPMNVSRLDLLNGEIDSLKHRLAMSAAAHPGIPEDTRSEVARDIAQMDEPSAQGFISIAVEDHLKGSAPSL